MSRVVYSKFNKVRKPEFQLVTSIIDDNGVKRIVKKVCDSKAKDHLNSLKSAYDMNKKIYENIIPLQGEWGDGQVVYPFLNGFSAASYLTDYINDLDKLCEKINYYIDDVMIYKEDNYCDFQESEQFIKVFGDSKGYKGKAFKCLDVDLTLDNLLRCDDKWYSYDYEWTFEFPIPVAFLKFRIIYRYYSDNIIYFKDILTHIEFAERFGITREETELFEQWELSFLKYVYGDEYQYIYTDNYQKKRVDLQNLIKTYGNLEDAFNARNESIWTYEKVKKDLDAQILNNNKIINEQHLEIEKQKKEIERQNKELIRQKKEIDKQLGLLEKYLEENKIKTKELEMLQNRYDILQANTGKELSDIMREYQILCGKLDDITNSKIWKSSKPIRKIIDATASRD